MSERCHSRAKDFFEWEPRGKVPTKEQKAMEMYFLKGVRPKLMEDQSASPPAQFVRRYQNYFEPEPPAFSSPAWRLYAAHSR
jgi:hypothetical protein